MEVRYCKDLLNRLLSIKCPVLQSQKDDKICVETMIVDFELAQKRRLLFHNFIKYIWKLRKIFIHLQRYPNMLVLIPFNRKPIVKQESPVWVRSISKIDLIIFFKPILLACSNDQILILMLWNWILEICCLNLVFLLLLLLTVIWFTIHCLEVFFYFLFITEYSFVHDL